MQLLFQVFCSITVAFSVIIPSTVSDLPCETPYTTYTAIIAMSKPNYQDDPCYNNWNNAENEKLREIDRKRKEFNQKIKDRNRDAEIRQEQNRQRQREEADRQNEENRRILEYQEEDARKTAESEMKSGNTKKYVLIVIGLVIVVGICSGCRVMCTTHKQKPVAPSQIQASAAAFMAYEVNPLVAPQSNYTRESSLRPRAEVHFHVDPVLPEPETRPAAANNAADDNPPSYDEAIRMPSASFQ